MAKANATVFFCKECGYETPKWMGQCPGCRSWNTFVEEPAAPKKSAGPAKRAPGLLPFSTVTKLAEISTLEEDRVKTGLSELDRVLGGGLVQGSLVLVGGDPGIGKSTILLQVSRNLAHGGKKVLYISGEESLKQIKMRANRLGAGDAEMALLSETSLDRIEEAIESEKPDFVVVDSIQTMYREDVSSAPGSVSQVRESTNTLLQIAKGKGITIFLVGHVTKEGAVAGPRVLEHMVDAVLYFEGDRNASYRVLRGVKNRFGSTNEIGVFEMQEDGLHVVENPSEYMLNGRPESASGSVVSCTMEGTRPLLIEIQALVCKTSFGLPRRTAAGTDQNRLNLLVAVLEKRLGLPLSSCDIYVNVTGGLRINEPSLDLAIMMAIMSSYYDVPIPEETLVFGEVGLVGEARAVSQADQRIAEAVKLGFSKIILPAANLKGGARVPAASLTGIRYVSEAGAMLKR